MSVATRARPSRSAERRSERPPWRWRSILLAVLAALFVASAAGLWFLSTRFAPLRLDADAGPSFVRTEAGWRVASTTLPSLPIENRSTSADAPGWRPGTVCWVTPGARSIPPR